MLNKLLLIVIALTSLGCSRYIYKQAGKSFAADITQQPYDAIIVPGFPYSGKSWDSILQMRIHWANYLFRKGYTRNIIFSGGAVATRFIESEIMMSYAEALGVPKKHLFAEKRAEHSTENVYYSYRLAKELGFRHIALATDPFQNSFMESFIKKFELPIASLPIVIDTLAGIDTYEPCIDSLASIKKDFVKLSDKENFFQRFKGTLGKNIVWYQEDLKKPRFRRRYRNRIIDHKE
ncbi:YdcF family protein [Dyadobacter tibetensis]|uniref:YdcF family protein n=1 Tax=Dyadobacter tibetensis TaxID=1211851 RepID=UPI00046F5313|nr:YdcF family protein [Dyadobacter tibetensis]